MVRAMRADASNAECLVFTFKEGVLSAVAHDLKLRFERFDIEADEAAGTVRARFETASLHVVCARRDGADAPGVLSDSDRRDIERRMSAEVLETTRHPEATFVSTKLDRTGDRVRVEGTLRLHGRDRTIAAEARPEGDRLVAEIVLHQPDWGVRPYSALLGAMKVRPDVRVRLSVPRP